MKAKLILAAAATLVVAAALFSAREPEVLSPGTDHPGLPGARRSPLDPSKSIAEFGRARRSLRNPAVPEAPGLPESLVDTEPDGALAVDASGSFVVDAGVRAFFDYFLAAAGEQSLAQLRAQIVDAIGKRLAPAAAAEAIAALDAYLEYHERTRELVESGEVPDDLGERLSLLRRLRREILGDTLAQAFFGLEEQVVAADLARREILTRQDLSAAERDRRLEENERSLPESVRAARAETLLPYRLSQDETALRAAGGSEEEIDSLREQVVGSEAAARLRELDREDAEWQARIDAYRAERAAIETDANLDPGRRAARLRALLEQRFAPNEQLRLEAIEAVPRQ